MELLDRWREGDRKAGNELFLRHFDSISRFFESKIDHQDTDAPQGCRPRDDLFTAGALAEQRREVEGAATAVSALDPHATVHGLRELG